MSAQLPQESSPAIFPEARRLLIMEELRSRETVRGDELARRFGVSPETVRRDLLSLEDRGLVRRVYGGAVLAAPRDGEAPFEARVMTELAAKQAMARAAADLISAGDVLTLDVGTSVAEIARRLPDHFTGRVLTNSLLAAAELARRPGVELHVMGGRVRSGDLACSGDLAEDGFARFYADKAFLGSGGVHPEAGLTDYHLAEIATRRVIISHARERYVLADSTKIGRIAVGWVCPLDTLTAIITDDQASPDAVAALENTGVRVIIAETARAGTAASSAAAGTAAPASPAGGTGSAPPGDATASLHAG